MSWERITSRDNPYLKRLAKLASSARFRAQEGVYLCEGMKLLLEALRDGVTLQAVICPEQTLPALSADAALTAALHNASLRTILVPDALFAHISILENSPGPLFVCTMPQGEAPGKGSYIALDGVQDPGNIGTILRTAEAFGVDGVILLPGCADPFAPKTVRASMGSVFRTRILRFDADGLFAFARDNGLPVYAAALYENSVSLPELPHTDAVVLIGSEGQGVRPENIRRCTGSVRIPMCGKTESLNAAVAAAVVMWEMKKWQTSTGSGFPS